MKRIKSSEMKRKKRNMIAIEKVDLIHQDSVDLEAKADSEVSDELIFEILILATLWVVFLVADSADDLEEKALKAERTSR